MKGLKGLSIFSKYGIGAVLILLGFSLCIVLFAGGMTCIISFVRDKLSSRPLSEYRREKFNSKVFGLIVFPIYVFVLSFFWYGCSTIMFGNYLEDTWLDRLLFGILGYW